MCRYIRIVLVIMSLFLNISKLHTLLYILVPDLVLRSHERLTDLALYRRFARYGYAHLKLDG